MENENKKQKAQLEAAQKTQREQAAQLKQKDLDLKELTRVIMSGKQSPFASPKPSRGRSQLRSGQKSSSKGSLDPAVSPSVAEVVARQRDQDDQMGALTARSREQSVRVADL